jgi:hypothetical protein
MVWIHADCLHQALDVVLQSSVCAARSPHSPRQTLVLVTIALCFGHFDALFVRQRDGQRECITRTYGQITRESPAGTRNIPHAALVLEWPWVVRDGALHGEAMVGMDRERQECLAETSTVGGD